MFKIGELNRLYLGVQGENGARTIEIDVSEWLNTYPNGTVTIWSRRNGDNMNYTPTGIVFDSVHKVIKWTPTAVDTFYAGHGMCGVELNEGTVVKKSKDLDTFVTASAADIPTADGNQYDYNRSINKPQINGNTLVGDMDFRDLDLFDDENMTSREKAVSAGKAAEELAKKADKDGEEISSKIPKTDIVNNLTTTVEGKVLDARQGKALNDGKLDKTDVIADYAQTTAGKALDATKGRELYLNKIDKPSGVGEGKFLQTDQDGNPYWGGSASPQEIAADIDAWMTENVPSGTTIAIDRSLQASNAAAPADLVGDLKSALAQDEGYIADLQGTVGMTFSASKSISHGSTLSAEIEAWIFYINIKKDGEVSLSATDTANTGIAFTTYVKYKGASGWTNIQQPVTAGGSPITFTAQNDIVAIGFYKNQLSDGVFTATAEVQYDAGLLQQTTTIESKLEEADENIQRSYNSTGATYKKETNIKHGSTVSASDIFSIPVNSKKGCIIDLLVTDANNTGASLTTYFKISGSYTNIGKSTTVGTVNSLYAYADVERISFYATGLTSGEMTVEATVRQTVGDKQNIDSITPLLYTGKNNHVTLLNQSVGSSGIETYNPKRLVNVPIYFTAGTKITLTRGSFQYGVRLWQGDISAENLKRADQSWQTTASETIEPQYDGYCIINFRKSDESYITPSSFDGSIVVEIQTKKELTALEEQIEYRREAVRTWEHTASARPLYLVLDKPIRAGTPFVVTIIDPDEVLATDWIAYYTSVDGTNYVRDGEIMRNDPAIKSYDFDIYAFQIYATSSSDGDVTLRVDTLSEMGDAISKGGLSYFLHVPDYYFENGYLKSKIERIKALIEGCACNGDIFFFITDQHWEIHNQKHSPALIKYIADRVNIPRLFSGGDMQSDGILHELNQCYKMAFRGKRYYAVGNHEYLASTGEDKIAAEYFMENDDIVYGDSNRHYYYVNNNQKKIRYVILNAYGLPEAGSTAASKGYTTEQKNWLANTALNVESGWTIIIFTHCLYSITAIDSKLYVFDADVKNIIASYSGNGTIAAVIQGHTHRDRYTILSNGVPVIITTCDKNRIWRYEGHDDIDVTRNNGTIAEQAFEVVVLNKTTRKINMVRIGAQARNGEGDTPGDLVEEREFSY